MSNRPLNCQGNQYALIIHTPATDRHLIGKIIRITTRGEDEPQNKNYPQYDTTATWLYAGPRIRNNKRDAIERVNDCALRPLIDHTQNPSIESTIVPHDPPTIKINKIKITQAPTSPPETIPAAL